MAIAPYVLRITFHGCIVTGVPILARAGAAETMLGVIRGADRPVGFKAAGGIRTVRQAAGYLCLTDRIMGPAWATPRTFRFGASSLLDALRAVSGEKQRAC